MLEAGDDVVEVMQTVERYEAPDSVGDESFDPQIADVVWL